MPTLLQTLREGYADARQYPSEEDRTSRALPSDSDALSSALGWSKQQGRGGGRVYVTPGGMEIPAWAPWAAGALLAYFLFSGRRR